MVLPLFTMITPTSSPSSLSSLFPILLLLLHTPRATLGSGASCESITSMSELQTVIDNLAVGSANNPGVIASKFICSFTFTDDEGCDDDTTTTLIVPKDIEHIQLQCWDDVNDTEGTNCNIECSGGRHMFISSGSTVTIDGFNFKNAETTSVALASGSSFIGSNLVFDNNEATKYAWTITGGAIGAGIDYGFYPVPRQFLLGMNLKF